MDCQSFWKRCYPLSIMARTKTIGLMHGCNATSASSLRPLRVLDRLELFVPRTVGLGQLWLNLYPFRLLALPFEIAFHHQLVLLSYHPIFLLPYHFLKLLSFLLSNL